MKKISNALMLVLLIAAVFIYYTEMIPLKVDAVKLAASYSKNKTQADKNFLDKELEVTGTVKAFYKLLEVRNVLELNTGESEISLFCFFMNEIDENKAARFSEGDTVIVIGECAGLDKYNFVNGVIIDVKKIK
ncbi:MAG: hypothetical protein IH784_02825 [Bacteroidetes bacterium]|nr:hypothetical protein [Bacteroidota bacterium]